MYKKIFMIVFLFSIFCIPVAAIDTESDKPESLLNSENENIIQNKSDKEVILNCVSKRTPRSKIEGNSYIFVFRNGKLYDEDNTLLKKQKITDSTFRFTYKKRQDFTWEKSRFTIDRYTGRYKSYNRYYDFYTSSSKRESGICKQIKDKKAF